MKSKFKDLIYAASTKGNSTELMVKITDELDELMGALEEAHPDMYWDVMHELHVIVHGPHFDAACLEYALAKMDNSDGTTGAHWSLSDTNAMASAASVYMNKFNEYDWNYVMNMVYSDYYTSLKDNAQLYVSIAKDWIMDKDAPEGKAYKYWRAMHS